MQQFSRFQPNASCTPLCAKISTQSHTFLPQSLRAFCSVNNLSFLIISPPRAQKATKKMKCFKCFWLLLFNLLLNHLVPAAFGTPRLLKAEKYLPSDDLFVFDLDYFLNEKLMPLSLMAVVDSNSSMVAAASREATVDNDLLQETDNGSLDAAFSTMGFHRKMINEYLCSNYVAEEILMDIVPPQPVVKKTEVLQRRILNTALTAKKDPIEVMKFDEGSSGYKDWLSK